MARQQGEFHLNILVETDNSKRLELLSVELVLRGCFASSTRRGAAQLTEMGRPAFAGVVIDSFTTKRRNETLNSLAASELADKPILVIDDSWSGYVDWSRSLPHLIVSRNDVTGLDLLVQRCVQIRERERLRDASPSGLGDLQFDPVSGLLWIGSKVVSLSPSEKLLLHELMTHSGVTVSRRSLHEKVYGHDLSIGSNALDVHIHNLRRKIGRHRIMTIRGMGYALHDAVNR